MVGWLVRDRTVNAVTEIPGVSAIFLKGGACLLGEVASLRSTLWHSAQTRWAYARPLRASPTSCPSAIGTTVDVFACTAPERLLMYATIASIWGPESANFGMSSCGAAMPRESGSRSAVL